MPNLLLGKPQSFSSLQNKLPRQSLLKERDFVGPLTAGLTVGGGSAVLGQKQKMNLVDMKFVILHGSVFDGQVFHRSLRSRVGDCEPLAVMKQNKVLPFLSTAVW